MEGIVKMQCMKITVFWLLLIIICLPGLKSTKRGGVPTKKAAHKNE
eukprot:UN05203